jgi:hypothetical protein
MKIIEQSLQVYYNPIHNGFHVVHDEKDKTIIVSDCCRFYNDAFTCILRYEISKNILKNWIAVDKEKLLDYDFTTIDEDVDALKVREKKNVENKHSEDYIRCTWTKDIDVINKNY